MTDFDRYQLAKYRLEEIIESSLFDEEREDAIAAFIDEIQDLDCASPLMHFNIAQYKNRHNNLETAKYHINLSISLIENAHYPTLNNIELKVTDKNGIEASIKGNITNTFTEYLTHQQLQDIYGLAGEIYARTLEHNKSFEYYKKSLFYGSFIKTPLDSKDSVYVFSFRKYNQYTIEDLVNETITVNPSYQMNDPFDSLINLWGDEDNLKEISIYDKEHHVKPLHDAFKLYRIRSFCYRNNAIKNILMWSHYADEHKGFCIKYKLSKHFIKQEETGSCEHMYLDKVNYRKIAESLNNKSITLKVALATKKSEWKYENEIRLIVYNGNKTDEHYGIPLDDESRIEAIYFGYRCPSSTIKCITNIFKQKNVKQPNFFKATIDKRNVYNLIFKKIQL